MPVTLVTANHPSRGWMKAKVTASDDLFRKSCRAEYGQSRNIIQSSIPRRDFREKHITPSENGLVWAAFNAYSGHHHLIIRPEDVWFAILSQLNFFINGHAEEFRDYFVSHKGQKELEVIDVGSMKQADFGAMACRMTEMIQNNVKLPDFREWIMPSFSTTTDCDRTVAAILMMGAMQKYFTYKMTMSCGIPSVTLLGERKDWEDISRRLDKLNELGEEPSTFAKLLRPILRNFIASFDEEPSTSTTEFWGKIADRDYMGSGPDYLTGWITAFCFWDEKGKLLYHPGWEGCNLDGVGYHQVDTDDVPSGFASVPVTIDDNGEIWHAKMLAGSFGIQATSSGKMMDNASTHANSRQFTRNELGKLVPVQYIPAEATEEPGLDTLQPLSGWFMYEKDAPPAATTPHKIHLSEPEDDMLSDAEIDENEAIPLQTEQACAESVDNSITRGPYLSSTIRG